MGTPQKMQHYMERHRLSSLFEDLMNKVLHDQPDKPLLYMIKVLYKKAGMDVPTDLKLAGVRRSSPERIMQRSKSPEMTRKSTTQAWASKSIDVANRGYDKPWQSHSKKPKAKEVETEESTKPAGRKQKPAGWNADNKVGFSTFEEMFDDTPGKSSKQKKKSDPSPTDAGKAWATSGLNDDNVQYHSTNYRGPRTHRADDNDPLAGEIMNEKSPNDAEETFKVTSTSRVRGRRIDAKSHRKELGQMITEESKNDSGYGDEAESDGEQDEAIELLEDGDELRKEGARHISKSGFKLSRILKERQQEANVKLNINLYTGPQPADSLITDTLYEDNKDGYYDSDDERPPTGQSGYRDSPADSDVDDEFESVSQVTGPRRPVWNVVDSDGESFIPKASKTLPEPSRSKSSKFSTDRYNTSSVPSKAYVTQSMESADSFLQGGKTWSPATQKDAGQDSVVGDKSERGGWTLPRYESDASILDWSTTEKSVDRGKPRAY